MDTFVVIFCFANFDPVPVGDFAATVGTLRRDFRIDYLRFDGHSFGHNGKG